jgi:hypothetical protein
MFKSTFRAREIRHTLRGKQRIPFRRIYFREEHHSPGPNISSQNYLYELIACKHD